MLRHFEHRMPGGMMTNLTRQLREVGMLDRLDEILEGDMVEPEDILMVVEPCDA